ncbi:MAG: hypothetical protein ACREBJ_04615 [Nitrosotalea sp.]
MTKTLDDLYNELSQIKLLVNDYVFQKKKIKGYVLSGMQTYTTASGSGTFNITLNDKYYTDLNIWVASPSPLVHDSKVTITTVTESDQAPLTVSVGLNYKRMQLSGVRVNQISIYNPDNASVNVTYYVSYIQYREPTEVSLQIRNA